MVVSHWIVKICWHNNCLFRETTMAVSGFFITSLPVLGNRPLRPCWRGAKYRRNTLPVVSRWCRVICDFIPYIHHGSYWGPVYYERKDYLEDHPIFRGLWFVDGLIPYYNPGKYISYWGCVTTHCYCINFSGMNTQMPAIWGSLDSLKRDNLLGYLGGS